MATMDDKLLGEKTHYYCSSSEDEEEAAGGGPGAAPAEPEAGPRTGPKGVLEDWRRYKQLETEKREEQEVERLELAKKLALTCRSEREDREADAKQEEDDKELEALLDDEFLRNYMAKRMHEMVEASAQDRKHFGHLFDLETGDDFLRVVDNPDHKKVTIIVHIWEPAIEGCEAVNGCLNNLAKDYGHVKFCRIKASSAGLSKHFKVSGVPAILTYRGGELMANFVRITDTLGDDFFASDLESFLIEHGCLTDKSLLPTIIKGPASAPTGQDGSDSD